MWLTYHCWCQVTCLHSTPLFVRRPDTSMTDIIGQVAGGTHHGQGCHCASLAEDRCERRTNPFVYEKFWKKACLPSLMFGSELFILTHSLLLKLEPMVPQIV